MSRGLNKVQCLGYLGRDPEIRALPSGGVVANFSVAVTESWNDRDSGEKKERTEWFSITCFGKLAEIAEKYLQKGKQAYIEGRQRTEKWEKDGVTRYSTKLYADQIILLGGGGGREPNEQELEEDARQQGRQQGDPGPSESGAGRAPSDPSFDDSIPF